MLFLNFRNQISNTESNTINVRRPVCSHDGTNEDNIIMTKKVLVTMKRSQAKYGNTPDRTKI